MDCTNCLHENRVSSEFPCSECSRVGNGYEDMFVTKAVIADSGNRTEFSTGAVRDIQEGKGRCDLMPLDVVARLVGGVDDPDYVLISIHDFMLLDNPLYLFEAIEFFRNMQGDCMETIILEVAKHFEEGAKKYGENNWQKGIPVKRYIDSAVRHYIKFLRGDMDEPHDRAFVWNIICGIWTCMHKPELNDYAKREDDDNVS